MFNFDSGAESQYKNIVYPHSLKEVALAMLHSFHSMFQQQGESAWCRC